MSQSILPMGMPQTCEWCSINRIETNGDARRVLIDCKPTYQRAYRCAYGCVYQIICKECYDWAKKHKDLDGQQTKLIKRFFDGDKVDKSLNLKSRINELKQITLKEARRYCEPERLEAWISGYATAIDDINEIIDQAGKGNVRLD
jgi:hypothetical protein